MPFTQLLAQCDRPKARPSRAARNRRSRSARILRTETGEFVGRRDVFEHAAHEAKPINAVPFRLISIGGTGTTTSVDQPRSRQPAGVRQIRPAPWTAKTFPFPPHQPFFPKAPP